MDISPYSLHSYNGGQVPGEKALPTSSVLVYSQGTMNTVHIPRMSPHAVSVTPEGNWNQPPLSALFFLT